MSGLISPRFARHLPFSSKRNNENCDRSRTPGRSRTIGYDAPSLKLPTHRENSTVSTSTRKSGDASHLLKVSTFGNSCSSMQSLSSIDSHPSGFYSQTSSSHQRYPKELGDRGLFDNIHHGYVSLRRDPTVFGPRRTSYERNNPEYFNSNLFLNINQGKHEANKFNRLKS